MNRRALAVVVTVGIVFAVLIKLYHSGLQERAVGWLITIAYLGFVLIRLILGKSAPLGFAVIAESASGGERAFAACVALALVVLATAAL